MSTAIEKSDSRAIVTVRVSAMRVALDEESAMRDMVKEYVGKHMVTTVDYGVIPGTEKPTLLKPGAQKLISLFRCTPSYKLVQSTEDFESGLFSYTFRVRLRSNDTREVLAEGYGSANSREGRYRWRNANRKCPACAREAIIQGKAEYGGGWVCFKKKGGCGAKFATGDASIEGQAQGQVENEDVATLANTILKMAKKRAEVDGAIALAHCADMFTQDLEDMDEEQLPVKQEPSSSGKRTVALKDKLAARIAEERPRPSTQAPAQVKPKVQVVDVQAGETEEQATQRATAKPKGRWEQLVEFGALFGKTPEQMATFARTVLGGKVQGLTDADVILVRDALSRTSKMIVGSNVEPPPPSDSDFIPEGGDAA